MSCLTKFVPCVKVYYMCSPMGTKRFNIWPLGGIKNELHWTITSQIYFFLLSSLRFSKWFLKHHVFMIMLLIRTFKPLTSIEKMNHFFKLSLCMNLCYFKTFLFELKTIPCLLEYNLNVSTWKCPDKRMIKKKMHPINVHWKK